MADYGIYSETDLINKSLLDSQCNLLITTADEWDEVATNINNTTIGFTKENLSIEDQTPLDSYTELTQKMKSFAEELREYAEAVKSRVATIETEQKEEIARHQREEAEIKRQQEEYEQWKKDNKYTNTVDPQMAYSSSTSDNTVSNSVSNSVSNTVSNTVVY